MKEMHETVHHFHQPATEEEANAWLLNFLVRYNESTTVPNRARAWRTGCKTSIRPAFARCVAGRRFCTFTRERERRRVDSAGYFETNHRNKMCRWNSSHMGRVALPTRNCC